MLSKLEISKKFARRARGKRVFFLKVRVTRLVDGEGGEVASKQRRGGRRVASKGGWKVGRKEKAIVWKGTEIERGRGAVGSRAAGSERERERERAGEGSRIDSAARVELRLCFGGRTTPLCTLLSLYVCAVSTLLCPKVCLFAAPHSPFSATFLCVHAELRARYPSPRRVYTYTYTRACGERATKVRIIGAKRGRNLEF